MILIDSVIFLWLILGMLILKLGIHCFAITVPVFMEFKFYPFLKTKLRVFIRHGGLLFEESGKFPGKLIVPYSPTLLDASTSNLY